MPRVHSAFVPFILFPVNEMSLLEPIFAARARAKTPAAPPAITFQLLIWGVVVWKDAIRGQRRNGVLNKSKRKSYSKTAALRHAPARVYVWSTRICIMRHLWKKKKVGERSKDGAIYVNHRAERVVLSRGLRNKSNNKFASFSPSMTLLRAYIYITRAKNLSLGIGAPLP